MTPLRQRFIEDMQLRNLAPTTQRSYVHYVAEYGLYFNRSPELLDLEAVRQYKLYLLRERKLSAQSVNTFTSAVQFLYLETLDMPWKKRISPASAWRRHFRWCLAPTKSGVCSSTSRASRTAPL